LGHIGCVGEQSVYNGLVYELFSMEVRGERIMNVYVLYIWDHSKLGGPMGSESVDLLATRLFSTEGKALRHAIKQARRYGYKWDRKKSDKHTKNDLLDIGAIGLEIRKMRVR